MADYKQKWREEMYGARSFRHFMEGERISIPARVQEAQHRRLNLRHTNVTAALMRDPLPGFSALDRKRAGAGA